MTKLLFCPSCAKEQPATKTYLQNRSGSFSSRRVWACLVCNERLVVSSKMRNKPTVSRHTLGPNGKPRIFQSKLEADREPTLLALQNAGHIKDLRYQVPFDLEVYGTQPVEALLAAIADLDVSMTIRQLAQDVSRAKHYICKWIADYAYIGPDSDLCVEDVKGRATREYRIKRRLILACHGLEILEPSSGGIQQRARGAGVSGRGTGSRLSGNGRRA